MKLYSLIAILLFVMLGCSDDSGEKLRVKTSVSKTLVIPTVATSCLAKSMAGTTEATKDITASYIRIPTLAFTKRNQDKDLYIVMMKVTIPMDSGAEVTCSYGGDSLAALSTINATNGVTAWWNIPNHDALIPAGTSIFFTDCALYCGGLSSTKAYSSTGKIELIGYEQDPAGDTQEPFRASTYFQVENPL